MRAYTLASIAQKLADKKISAATEATTHPDKFCKVIMVRSSAVFASYFGTWMRIRRYYKPMKINVAEYCGLHLSKFPALVEMTLFLRKSGAVHMCIINGVKIYKTNYGTGSCGCTSGVNTGVVIWSASKITPKASSKVFSMTISLS